MRMLLIRILPLLLPIIILIGWMIYNRRKALAKGLPAPTLKDAPWVTAGIVGIATLIFGLFYLDYHAGERPGGTYVPAKIEDGRLVPGHIERE